MARRKKIILDDITKAEFKALLDYHTNLDEETKIKFVGYKDVIDEDKMIDIYWIRN